MNNSTYILHLFEKIKLEKLEYDTLTRIIKTHEREITEYINNYCNECGVNMLDLFEKQKDYSSENNENEIKINSTINDTDDYLTLLYRKLAVKLHPDKLNENNDNNENNGNNDNDNNNDNNEFIQIKNAYDHGDYVKLLEYSHKYNLKIDEINDEDTIIVLHKQLYTIEKSVKYLKNSFGYNFLICKNDLRNNMHNMIDLYKANQQLKIENQQLKINDVNNKNNSVNKQMTSIDKNEDPVINRLDVLEKIKRKMEIDNKLTEYREICTGKERENEMIDKEYEKYIGNNDNDNNKYNEYMSKRTHNNGILNNLKNERYKLYEELNKINDYLDNLQ